MHDTMARKPVELEKVLSLMGKGFWVEKCWIGARQSPYLQVGARGSAAHAARSAALLLTGIPRLFIPWVPDRAPRVRNDDVCGC